MFRLLFRDSTPTKSIGNLCSKFTSFSTSTESQPLTEYKKQEKLNVTLCGIIRGSLFTRPDGAAWLTVNTRDPRNASFANHNVFLTRDKTDLYGDRCTEGQKVYMNGVITYTDISLSDGRKRRAANITATNFFLCDPIEDDQDGTFDVNDVKLFGRVLNEARNNTNVTFLDVDTRYFDRNEQSYKFRHHELKIFDENLRELANTFHVGTRVLVNGRIDPYMLEGQKKSSVHIRPYSLFSCSEQ